MLDHYLTLNGTEIFSSARLAAYVEAVELGLTNPINLTSIEACGCPTLTAEALGDDPYVSPELDPAPWFDPDVPESADFTGLMVLSVDGLDNRPYTRNVTRGVTGHAALGRPRLQPRTITVTALLLGSTCCGVDYGLRWLGEALAGCGGQHCDGDDVCLFSCCPTSVESPEEFEQRYGRTIRRVALTEGPTVTARNGDGCSGGGDCQSGADVLTVEFVLTAAVPWLWTCPEEVFSVAPPLDTSSDCISWCVHDPDAPEPPPPVCIELPETCPDQGVEFTCADCPAGTVPWPDDELCEGESPGEPEPCSLPCRLRECPDPQALCRDDTCVIPAPPVAPPPDTCFCNAIAVETDCYELDLTDRPGWFEAATLIRIEAGSSDLRRLTIAFYERTQDHQDIPCDELAELERCNPHSVDEVGYVPAGGVLELDGQVRRATVTCGGITETSPDVWGVDGAPLSWQPLSCGEYCVCISADAIFAPAPDANITISVSGREY